MSSLEKIQSELATLHKMKADFAAMKLHIDQLPVKYISKHNFRNIDTTMTFNNGDMYFSGELNAKKNIITVNEDKTLLVSESASIIHWAGLGNITLPSALTSEGVCYRIMLTAPFVAQKTLSSGESGLMWYVGVTHNSVTDDSYHVSNAAGTTVTIETNAEIGTEINLTCDGAKWHGKSSGTSASASSATTIA